MGLLAPNTDNLCQFRHNSECSSAWYIVINVFSLKNRVHIAIYTQHLALTQCSNVWSCIPSLTGLIVLDAFPSFDSLFGILLEWLFHYIPAVVI